ncbi:MAG TPA: VWA domain-containing protein [Vicinamibacteria bacterium]
MIRERIALFCSLALVAAAAAQEKPPAAPSPAASPSPAAQAPTAETPSFPAQIELVNVDVVVTDKKNVSVPGLTQADFTLLEDGVPQSISSFDAVTAPAAASAVPPPRPVISRNTTAEVRAGTGRTFMVVFDDIHLSPQQAHRAKSAVAEFLRSGVREGDRVSLVATGGGAWWSTRMEAGREELIAMLKRLDGRHIPDTSPDRMSDYEAMRIHVFHDTQVEERVSRRFDTYGVAGRGNQSNQESLDSGTGDPFVRGRATEVYFQAVSRNRITLQVLQRVLLSLASTKGRKSLVLVSEGFIYDPNLDEFKQVIQASRRANVAIYFLDTRGLEGTSTYFTAEFGPALDSRDVGAAFAETLEASEGSESLAADSGGFSVKNTNDLAKGVQRIADESRNYYLLGYHPTNVAPDGRFRKIEVKVAKGLKVRARKGYYAPLPGGKSALDKKAAGGDPDIQAALDSPYEEAAIPLRMTSYIYDETLLGKARVVVAAEVDMKDFSFEEKDGRFVGSLETLMIVAHRETGEYFRPPDQKVEMKLLPATKEKLLAAGYPLSHEFDLAPGGYQAKVVVRDKARGAIGTVIHEFEVPELGSLRVSTPLITDTLQQDRTSDKPSTPSAARPALVVRREFPAEGMLYCQYEVYGAQTDKKSGMPKVSAGYQIRRTDGTVVTSVPPSVITPTSIGKLSRMVGTGVQGAAPGEYELVLSVKDELSGKSVEVREPFTLVGGRKPAADASGAASPR